MYNFKEIENKWQSKWEDESSFRAVDFHPTKPKYYVLYEFYNISGNLHMGHLKGSVPADALARMKRLQGYNVLFPIGGDAFGLPAENAAIKTGINPKQFVSNGVRNVIDQSKKIGLSFDYDRMIVTSDEDYYKWTQWIFLQLLKNDKAYKEKGVVNYCPNCKTVLSNEDSQNGVCDRCHGKVLQRDRWVWYLKMKEYADKLLGNVDRIQMSENLKELQRNWIGKTEGYEVEFKIVDKSGKIIRTEKVFTKELDSLKSASFLLMAPEHSFIRDNSNVIPNINAIREYQEKTMFRSEFERISSQGNKTGCLLSGIFAVNPLTGDVLPIVVTDSVILNSGTGISIASNLDKKTLYAYAELLNIPINNTIESDMDDLIAILINSGKITKKTEYKMQDWPFNRQRYWGEPFPVVFCDHCGTVPLSEKDLPLELPYTNDFMPNENGDSPLSKITDWVNTTCPICGRKARRETDTMPNWAGSSWYWLRYCDPHNDNALADFDKLKYWGSVDCYTGGTEHITRHVLYAFFWQNFLYEIGAVPTRDPFIRKMGSGLILDSEGKKMSKSSTNGVSPMEVIDKYGSDAARLHVHFLGGYEDNTPWTYDGINGITNFLNKVWNLQDMISGEGVSSEHESAINDLCTKVTSDIEALKLNTAIAAYMSFINVIKRDKFITKEELRRFLIVLNPLAPHITSEIYERVFGKNIVNENWPLIGGVNKNSTTNIVINLNNKKKLVLPCPKGLSQEDLLEYLSKQESFNNIFGDISFDGIYYVPDRMINIISKTKRMEKVDK